MSDLEWLAVFAVTVLSSARLTRLVVTDAFPPVAWIRAKWDDLTEPSGWNLLLHCFYCLSFWTTLVILGLGWLSDWHPAWWFINATLGASYLAAVFVVKDGED